MNWPSCSVEPQLSCRVGPASDPISLHRGAPVVWNETTQRCCVASEPFLHFTDPCESGSKRSVTSRSMEFTSTAKWHGGDKAVSLPGRCSRLCAHWCGCGSSSRGGATFGVNASRVIPLTILLFMKRNRREKEKKKRRKNEKAKKKKKRKKKRRKEKKKREKMKRKKGRTNSGKRPHAYHIFIITLDKL